MSQDDKRKFEKESHGSSGLCSGSTGADDSGRDLGGAGEPAQLSGEAAAVKNEHVVGNKITVIIVNLTSAAHYS